MGQEKVVMKDCKICHLDFNSGCSLSKHIRDNHCSIKDYVDNHLKLRKTCLICGKEVKFIGLIGYQKTCSHSCGCKFHRKNLKSDTEKMKKFSDKVKKNVKEQWKQPGFKETVAAKISETLKKNFYNLSENERKERFGWLNKLSPEERQQKIEEIILPLRNFYENVSSEKLDELIEKRRKTMEKNGFKIPSEYLSAWEFYLKEARRLTEKTYRKYKHVLGKRSRNGNHLDHILSIFDGFINGVPLNIISSIHNLQILDSIRNHVKNKNSWQTPEELMEKFNGNKAF